MFFKAMSERDTFIRQTLGKDWVNPKDSRSLLRLLPEDEDWAIYHFRPGRVMFTAKSIPEHIAEQAFAKAGEEVGITGDDISDVMALAGEQTPMILPGPVARQLEATERETISGAAKVMDNIVRYPIKWWKQWKLLGPKHVLAYNIRNFTEADKVTIMLPGTWRHVARAAKELSALYESFRGKASKAAVGALIGGATGIPGAGVAGAAAGIGATKLGLLEAGGKVTPELREYMERGGLSALVLINELGEVNELRDFAKFLDKSAVQHVAGIPKKVIGTYWDRARAFTNWREAVLRYASYLEAKRQVESNADGMPSTFGFSNPAEVRGIKDPLDRAARISNDLLGDYSDVSPGGQFLRERLIPFWSFQEVNLRGYLRGIMNISTGKGSAESAGKKTAARLAPGVRMGAVTAYRVGQIALLYQGLNILLDLFNNLFFPDEEENLNRSIRNAPHIVLGTDENGRIRTFNRLGTSHDAFEWGFGLSEWPAELRDIFNGKKTVGEAVSDMWWTPWHKMINGSSPFLKLGLEYLTGKSLFPDPSRPRTIRDRAEHLFQQFDFGEEYRALMAKPSRDSYGENLRQSIYPVRRYQAGAAQYHEFRELFYKFKESIGEGRVSSEGARSDALFYHRQALKFRDRKAAIDYLEKYEALVRVKHPLATDKQVQDNVDTSLRNLHPLGNLSHQEREAFLGSLNEYQKGLLADAIEYYENTILDPVSKAKLDSALLDRSLYSLTLNEPKQNKGESATDFANRHNQWRLRVKHARGYVKSLDMSSDEVAQRYLANSRTIGHPQYVKTRRTRRTNAGKLRRRLRGG